MKHCKLCHKEFPLHIVIDGKRRNLKNRKYCLECSPFMSRNTRKLTEALDRSKKRCPHCKKYLAYEHFTLRDNGTPRSWCKKCNNTTTVERLRKRKQTAIDIFGGKCVICGYNKYAGALEFHHLDPSKKDISFINLKNRMIETSISELKKCLLVCSNCHREIHAGIININDIVIPNINFTSRRKRKRCLL